MVVNEILLVVLFFSHLLIGSWGGVVIRALRY